MKDANECRTWGDKALRVFLAVVLVFGLSGITSTYPAYADTATLYISGDYLNFTQTDGHNGNTWRDNIMYINGQVVMCTDITALANNGESYWSQDMDSNQALMFGLYDKYLGENYSWDAATHYGYLQYMIWVECNGSYMDQVSPGPSDFWTVYEGAKAYYQANKDKYNASGTEWHSSNSQSTCFVPSVSPAKGKIQLAKSDGNPSMSTDNACYSLAGATYTVYSDAACTTSVATLTTDADGKAGPIELSVGTYYVKETGAAQGYSLDAEALSNAAHVATVVKGQTSTVTSTDLPQNDPLEAFLSKLDKETNSANSLGAGTLADAQFTVSYYDGQYDSVETAQASGNATRTWVFKTDENGKVNLNTSHKVSGDELYTDSNGNNTFPLGTYLIQETTAPVGYALDDETYVVHVTPEGTGEQVATLNETTVADQAIRSDITFAKRDASTSESMAGIPFLVVSQTTGEAHVIVTDEQGQFSSEASYQSHVKDADANDAAVENIAAAISKGEDGKYAATISKLGTIDEDVLTDESGTWFYGAADADQGEPSDSLSAFPYDTYSLYELPVSANEGTQLVSDTFVVKRNCYTIDLGTIDDVRPVIATTATDSADGDKYVVTDQSSVINDHVEYSMLVQDATYTMSASLVDSAGNEISSNQVEFTASDESGYVTVPISVDTSALGSQPLTVFEKLTDANGRELVNEDDLDNAQQTVTVVSPTIGTSVCDAASGDQTVTIAHHITIVDQVSYTNLEPNKEYLFTGTLHKRILDDTGACTGEEVLTDSDGNPVTASTRCTPETASGTVKVTFTFDGYDLADGDEIVAFEQVTRNGIELAAHADINDTRQTFTMKKPAFGTELLEINADTDHVVSTHEATTLSDKVTYQNLIVEHEYQAASLLFDRTTGLPLLTGDVTTDVTESELQEFASKLYQVLGIDAQPPTITFSTDSDGVTTIVTDFNSEDTLSSNGSDFQALATLVKDNPHIANHLVYGVTAFSPATENGTIDLALPAFDSTELAGHETVCFECLYDENDGDDAAFEIDTANDNQAIAFAQPALGTSAFNSEDMTKQVQAGKKLQIVDRVTYENLGYNADGTHTEYVMKGILYDKDTGEPLLVNGKEITAEYTFTPNDIHTGTVELTFPSFSTSALNDHTIVVFEELYSASDLDNPVAVHKDINSTEQSVGVGHNPSKAAKTYDPTSLNMMIALAASALLSAIAYALRKRRLAATHAEPENSIFVTYTNK